MKPSVFQLLQVHKVLQFSLPLWSNTGSADALATAS